MPELRVCELRNVIVRLDRLLSSKLETHDGQAGYHNPVSVLSVGETAAQRVVVAEMAQVRSRSEIGPAIAAVTATAEYF